MERAAAVRHVPSGFAACNPCNKNSSVPHEFVSIAHIVHSAHSLLVALPPRLPPSLSLSLFISLINYTRIASDFQAV